MRSANTKITGGDQLRGQIADLKKAGKRVVFANGCFDTLHVGHIRYLEGAKAKGRHSDCGSEFR